MEGFVADDIPLTGVGCPVAWREWLRRGNGTMSADTFESLIDMMCPQGAIVWIENPARLLDITKLKPKSISLHSEFMFTRSRYETPDMHEQGRLLN